MSGKTAGGPATEAKELHDEVVRTNRDFYDRNPEVLAVFNEASDNRGFDAYLRGTLALCLRRIASAQKRPPRILDVGTGQGHLLGFLAEMAPDAEVAGLDVSPGNIARARSRFPNVRLELGDFVRDFEPEGTYDLITAYSVLHHVVDWPGFLDKAARCLAPGGVLYLDHDPLKGLPTNLYARLWRLKHRGDAQAARMEYHALLMGGLDHKAIRRHLGGRFEVEICFPTSACCRRSIN